VNTRLRSTLATGAVALAVLALTTGCTGGKKKVAQTLTSSGSATAATTSPSASTSAAKPTPASTSTAALPTVNPLTGGKPVSGPVIAVKIDDTGPGRPQVNIDQADVVYVEEVEGGLDRLIGLYDTHKPVVGYVRSIRLSDPELLLQYGRITLAASGGSGPSLHTLAQAKLPSWLQDKGRGHFRRAPHPGDHGYINLTLDLAKVSKAIKTASARTGFVWNASPAGGSALPKATNIKTRVGSQTVQFVYDAKTRRYTRLIGGVKQHAADGKLVTTANVIVQECKVTSSSARDVNGNPQQFTHSIGKGTAHVFRNGREYSGTWSRASVTAPTVFRDAKGVQITLNPGGVWIALTRPKVRITTS
jgi:Protein of unknown function (DUF3048) C-terminal domain/Protein of unknown function (DUF3048) N-terminal domain